MIKRKREYYRNKVLETGCNINKLYTVLDSLTGNKKVKRLPDGFTDAELANMFLDFFEKKTEDVIKNFNVSESQGPVVEYTVPEI